MTYAPCVQMSTWKAYTQSTHKPYMKTESAETLSHYLARLRARAKTPMEAVAKELGFAGRSSVQRYFQDESITELKPVLARKLANVFYKKGDPPILLRDLRRLAEAANVEQIHAISDIAKILNIQIDEDMTSRVREIARPGKIAVVGTAFASNWREKTPSIDVPEGWLTMPVDDYDKPLSIYAVRIIGPSINKTAQDGYFAICRQFGEGNQAAPDGKFLHVERVKDGFTEWSIKRARWTKKGMLLYPHSDDPEHQEPLPMAGKDGTVTILGVVMAWHKPA